MFFDIFIRRLIEIPNMMKIVNPKPAARTANRGVSGREKDALARNDEAIYCFTPISKNVSNTRLEPVDPRAYKTH